VWCADRCVVAIVLVFLNSFQTDNQDVTVTFSGSGNVWRGTIPASTVVTWLLPADERLGNITSASSNSSGSGVPGSNAPFQFPNGTTSGNPADITGTGSVTACPTTSSSTSSATSASTMNVPVPNANRKVDWSTQPAWSICLAQPTGISYGTSNGKRGGGGVSQHRARHTRRHAH
jgi:hypothetical protein